MNLLSAITRGPRLAKAILTAKYVRPVPVFAQWETTYDCNMDCGFCNVNKHKRQWMPELSTERALGVIDQLADLGTAIINFSGGEPLLRKDIDQLILHARKKNMFVFMNSNGTYVGKNIGKVLGLDLIRISIDSTEVEHDALRKCQGAYANAVESIKALKATGIKTMINTVVTKELDFDKWVTLTELAKSLGIQIDFSLINRELQTIRNPKPSDLEEEQQNLMPDEKEFIQNVLKLKKKYGNVVASPKSYLMLIQKGWLEKIGCRNMEIAIGIKPDGSMSIPCSGFPAVTLNGDLRKAWFSEEANQARKAQGKYWFCNRCLFRCTSFATMLLDTTMLMDVIFSWRRLKD